MLPNVVSTRLVPEIVMYAPVRWFPTHRALCSSDAMAVVPWFRCDWQGNSLHSLFCFSICYPCAVHSLVLLVWPRIYRYREQKRSARTGICASSPYCWPFPGGPRSVWHGASSWALRRASSARATFWPPPCLLASRCD